METQLTYRKASCRYDDRTIADDPVRAFAEPPLVDDAAELLATARLHAIVYAFPRFARLSPQRVSRPCDSKRRAMDNLTQTTIAFVWEHQHWGAYRSCLCWPSAPATAILFGVGGLIAAADTGFWPIWIAAALGAIAGDWLAYDLAFRVKGRITALWPFRNHAALVSRGLAFFQRWGLIAVFIGSFFGPFRAIVPIAAGLYAMPWLKFQIAKSRTAAATQQPRLSGALQHA